MATDSSCLAAVDCSLFSFGLRETRDSEQKIDSAGKGLTNIGNRKMNQTVVSRVTHANEIAGAVRRKMENTSKNRKHLSWEVKKNKILR